MEDPWATPSPWSQSGEPKRQASDPWVAEPAAQAQDEQEAASTLGWGKEASWEADAAPSWEPAAELDLPARTSYEAPSWSPEGVETALPSLPTLQLEDLPIDSSPAASPEQQDAALPAPDIEGFGMPMDLPPIPSPELPSSPPLDDEGFGGFSSASAGWANEHDDGEEEPPMPSWDTGAVTTVEEREDEDGEGWGGVAESVAVPPAPEDQEWELAQQRLRRQEERAPTELVTALREAWTTLAKETSGEPMPIDPKLDQERDQAVANQQEKSDETIRTLANVPSDINTYPTVLSNTQTHQRFKESLARTNAKASSSFLARPARRQGRAGQSLSSTWDNEWTVRSKLGEPEAQPQEVKVDGEAPVRPGWGFWGRKSGMNTPQVLTTSGGGLLEVKDVSSPTAMATPLAADKAASIRSMSSRPASPAPAAAVVTPVAALPLSQPAAGSAPAPEAAPHPAAGPSAVSRFFGRLSRRPAAQRTPSQDLDAAKDLELSQDDFSFLAEVPSMSQPAERGTGDLLMMEGGRSEEMASLESMLSSKPSPLPAPLAPPPRGGPTHHNVFAAPRATAPKAPLSDMDLLSDMDFASPISPSQATTSPARSQGTDWDAFLTASPVTPSALPSAPALQPQSRVPTPLPPPLNPVAPSVTAPGSTDAPVRVPVLAPPSRPASGQPAPAFMGMPDLASAIAPMAPLAASSAFATPQRPSQSPAQPAMSTEDHFGDFGDFGGFSSSKPVGASSSSAFDDFGDFEEFSSPPPPTPPAKSPLKPASGFTTSQFPTSSAFTTLSPTPTAPSKPSIHAPTINLINSTAGQTGRWPAPASPVAPALDPPPQQAASQSFFKLPPPPGSSRAPTPLSQGFDAFGFGLGGEEDGLGMGLLQPTSAAKSKPAANSASGPFDLI